MNDGMTWRDFETSEERRARLEKRRAYYKSKHPDMATPRPKGTRTPCPSLAPPREVREMIEEAKRRRALRLRLLTQTRWPPSAIAASQIARAQRFETGSATAKTPGRFSH